MGRTVKAMLLPIAMCFKDWSIRTQTFIDFVMLNVLVSTLMNDCLVSHGPMFVLI